jgi:two-component system, OmpR family, sensor histidine kinase MtrB
MSGARRRGLGLRVRITLAFVGAALLVSALVAVATYALAERYLVSRRVDDAVQQGLANMRFAVQELPALEAVAEDEEIEPNVYISELANSLRARGSQEVLIITPTGEPIASDFGLDIGSVPVELARAVQEERVGYDFTASPPRQVVFGSPVPGSNLDAYFFSPLGDLDQTLAILFRVLVGVSVAAVLAAVLVGSRVSRRVVDPVRRASRAARRVAEGLFKTRLEVEGGDELAALATSFNEMAAALEQRISRERQFAGDVSHELRTPLTTLRASTDYLLDHADTLAPETRRATELLAADVAYLQRLVDDLLDLSRVEAGRVDMSWQPLNVADLAREVVARHTRTGDHEVRLEIEDPPDELTTVADKQRLERVLGNLVDNAMTHGEGRDVTLRIGAVDGTLRLSVEDRGPGIPSDSADRIFERFFKADPARHRGEGRGSGLGLAIARENAHLHGGEIRVYSGRGGGAKFELVLPRREAEQ